MSPANGAAANGRLGRPRGQSIRNQGNGEEEQKIPEESNEGEALGAEDRADLSLSDEDLHDDEETGLTREDKRRKRQKKRRNTMLDQRIVRDKITVEERKEADHNVVEKLLINGALIGLWYLFSLCISLVSAAPVYGRWSMPRWAR
jgi:solute carrier family 35 protein C2